MVCQLPAPLWINNQQTGLLSAVENVVDGYIVLNIAESMPVDPAIFDYYLIYFSSSLSNLFDAPKLITTENTVSVPNTILSLNQYIAVRVAQQGVSRNITSPNMINAGVDLVSFPADTNLINPLNPGDSHVVVDSAAGYPREDGYLLVDDEIILYSNIIDGYDGYTGFLIESRDPYGCNTIAIHLDGYSSIELFKGFEDLNTKGFKARGSCNLPSISWADPYQIGIRRVEDLGIGTSVKVQWYDAKAPAGFSRIYFNVYQGRSLGSLFNMIPIGVATSPNLEGIVPNVSPGFSYYYGVKATYQIQDLQLFGFDQLSATLFSYPDPVEVNEPDGYYFTTQNNGPLVVSSTTGFPLQGFLNIGKEVLQYSSITATSFNIIGRDLFTIGLVEDYPNGEAVVFFKGIQDGNQRFFRVIPSWDAARDVPLMPLPDGYNGIPADGYGGLSYNQDEDGYRSVRDDIVTEDHSEFEEDNSDFDTFPFCGYRASNPVDLYSRNQCGTYHGGRTMQSISGVNDGDPVEVAGGVDIFEGSQQRAEVILSVTGEAFILLRRKTTGRKCPRLSIRSEHPHARCLTCYGTTFLGGYDRFFNTREIQPAEPNTNGFVPMRVSPYNNDLELTLDRGLAQVDQLEAWTISVPIIKDRDILIRYILDESTGLYMEEFRYEVLHVNRNKLFFGKDAKQTVTMRKLDKTREQYKIPVPLV
jgi:hypothetical protein